MQAFYRDVRRQRQELSDQYQNLAHGLSSQEGRLNGQVTDVKTLIEGSKVEVVAAVHHYVSDGAAATQASIEANGNLTGERIRTLEQNLTLGHVNLARQNRRLHREIRTVQYEVKRMNARLGTLVITENEAAGDYSIFAGDNLHEMMLPLVLMQPGLLGFLSELVKSNKLTISRETLQDIEAKFEELLASCHDASAANYRRQRKADPFFQATRRAQAFYSPSRGRERANSRIEWTRSSFSMRSGIWKKSLPHGLLQVRLCPLRCRHRGKAKYSSDEYLVNLTFTPHSWEAT